MKVVGKNVTREEALFVKGTVLDCIRLLRKREYELDLPSNATGIAVRCLEVKRRARASSRAGAHLIRMNLGYWQIGNPVHIEYKTYNRHPVIGQIECQCVEDHLMVAIAHEVTHHVQYRHARNVRRFRQTYRKPHGDCFKSIYTYLRRDLVNPSIRGEMGRRWISK